MVLGDGDGDEGKGMLLVRGEAVVIYDGNLMSSE